MASHSVLVPSTRTERPATLAISPVSAAPSPTSALQVSPSSGASTPTSTTPQIAIKPAAAAAAANSPHTAPLASMASAGTPPGQPPKNSITSREWVIPPRPKPGRKPATDTPPTKRKAQNRAAQRAFRERRAARVGELEEQIEEQRLEYERTERELQDQVQGLDSEVRSLQHRCSVLEDMLEKERTERNRAENELEATCRKLRDEQASASSRHNSLPGLRAALAHHTPRSSITSNHSSHRNSSAFAISHLISPSDASDATSPTDQSTRDTDCGSCDPNGSCACVEEAFASTSSTFMECGKCTLGTRCECLEAALEPPINSDTDHHKRRPSSTSPLEPEEKRQRRNHSEHEIDFTAMFSRKRPSAPIEVEPIRLAPQTIAIPPRDSCGFCKEGTYCMCAEAAAAEAQSLPPMGSQAQTPPPSENDVGPTAMEFTSTGAVKLPRLSSLNRPNPRRGSKSGGCGPSGPGTCAQCLSDPKSGLFCRSLAASLEKQGGSSKAGGGGCCGGSIGGGCCKSRPNSTKGPSMSISCADAYKTLSSHRNFEKAADDIGSWLPILRAVPRPQEVGENNRRPPIEVETASIMSALKGFDVRFGREP